MKIQRRKKRQNESPTAAIQAQFQSRPFQDANFAPPDKQAAPPEREFQGEGSGFNLGSIPLFSNGNSMPTQPIQRSEEEDVQMQAESKSPLHGRFQTLAQRDNPKNSTPQQPIQAKLTVGAVGDKYEQEADRVADVVVDRIQSPAATTEVQKQEEETLQQKPQLSTPPTISKLQKKEQPETVQRESEEDEEDVQMKPQTAEAGGEVSADFESSLRREKGGGQPLNENLQSQMGRAMGADFGGVRIHQNSPANQLNQSIQAKAFTTGKDIFFKQGEYRPESRGGQKLIAHELTHVVQQGSGKISRSIANENVSESDPKLKVQTNSVENGVVQRDDGANPQKRRNAITPIDNKPLDFYKTVVDQLFEEKDWEKNGKKKKGTEYQRRDKFAYELLTDNEVEAIEELSKTPEGRKYLYSLKSSGSFTARKEFAGAASQKTEDIAEYYKKQAEKLDTNNNSPLTGDWLVTKSNYESFEFWSKREFTSMERLLMATYQAKLGQKNPDYQKTPGYLRYEALKAKEGSEEHKEAIYKKDTDAWEKLLNINEDNKETIKNQLIGKIKKDGKKIDEKEAKAYVEKSLAIANIMRRVFTVLQYKLEYSNDKNAQGEYQKEKQMYARDWNQWTKQVAVALSHGGRVNIVLPPIGKEQHGKKHGTIMNSLSSTNKKETQEYYNKRDHLLNWLLGVEKGHHAHERSKEDLAGTDYKNAEVGTRFVSTHDVEIKENSFKEKKGNNTSTGESEVHYGINPALGGLGETDLAGNLILPDGSHGHIYIFYKPPTSKLKGAILIGGETSEMGKRDVFGKLHNASGTSAEFSPTGTGKAARIGSEIGGMRVDLSASFSSQEAIVNLFEDAMQRGVEPGQLVGESKPEVREALFGLGLKRKPSLTLDKE